MWKSTADSGDQRPAKRAFYLAAGGTNLANIPLVDRAGRGGRGGRRPLPERPCDASTRRTTLTITGPDGPETVKLAWSAAFCRRRRPIWLDANGHYFAEVGGISIMPAGYEGNAQGDARFPGRGNRQGSARDRAPIPQRPQAKAPVLFDNVRLFDADKGVFIDDQAVLASDGKIAADRRRRLDRRARRSPRVIDGRGKTLVPGLWDSHMHIGDDWNVLANMATGITSFRSPGHRDRPRGRRWSSGGQAATCLMGEPFVVRRSSTRSTRSRRRAREIVTSHAEAIAAVRKMHDAGLWGVKFYTSMNPAWIAPAAAEAHRLGMHVLGHVPAGMRPLEAVRPAMTRSPTSISS